MAGNMGLIAKKCFPNAVRVTDRFHTEKLALETLQEIRIKYRWQAIELENEAIEKARTSKKKYNAIVLINDGTIIKLFVRSRYFLYKNKSKWSENQTERARLLFELNPDIEKAYDLVQDLRNIVEKTIDKIVALSRLARWHEKVNQSGFKSFNTISKSIINNYQPY